MSTTVSSNRNFPIELPLGLSVISGIFKFFIKIHSTYSCLTAVDCVEKLDLVSLRGQRGGGLYSCRVGLKLRIFVANT